MTSFVEQINSIQYNPTEAAATGIVAPLIRASGHLLYLLAEMSEHAEGIDDESAKREITEAAEHFNWPIPESDIISRLTREQIGHFKSALTIANDEWDNWTPEDRIQNLKSLAHRAAGIGTQLDWEYAGVIGSNPGRSF